MATSVANSSENEVVIMVEKDWFIYLTRGSTLSVNRRYSYISVFPDIHFRKLVTTSTHGSERDERLRVHKGWRITHEKALSRVSLPIYEACRIEPSSY